MPKAPTGDMVKAKLLAADNGAEHLHKRWFLHENAEGGAQVGSLTFMTLWCVPRIDPRNALAVWCYE